MNYLFVHLYRYYLSGYFKLAWSTAQSWTIYVMSIGVLLWSMVVQFGLIHFVFHSVSSYCSALAFAFTGLAYLFFDYRYLKNDKYLNVIGKYKVENELVNRFISIFIILILPLALIGILIILHKPT